MVDTSRDPAGAQSAAQSGAMPERLLELALATRGFMPPDEGVALHAAAVSSGATGLGPMVEIGAYCGKSTVYLGAACEQTGTVLFSVDHHRGSEENQAGWEHHDPTLVDSTTGRMDTLPAWRETIAAAGLEHCVVGVIGDSATIASHWCTPLSFLFIDGGHGDEPAWADYRGWSRHIAEEGVLAIHDVFPDPADGGRPPYEIYRAALDSGLFDEIGVTGSLRLLRRLSR